MRRLPFGQDFFLNIESGSIWDGTIEKFGCLTDMDDERIKIELRNRKDRRVKMDLECNRRRF